MWREMCDSSSTRCTNVSSHGVYLAIFSFLMTSHIMYVRTRMRSACRAEVDAVVDRSPATGRPLQSFHPYSLVVLGWVSSLKTLALAAPLSRGRPHASSLDHGALARPLK